MSGVSCNSTCAQGGGEAYASSRREGTEDTSGPRDLLAVITMMKTTIKGRWKPRAMIKVYPAD